MIDVEERVELGCQAHIDVDGAEGDDGTVTDVFGGADNRQALQFIGIHGGHAELCTGRALHTFERTVTGFADRIFFLLRDLFSCLPPAGYLSYVEDLTLSGIEAVYVSYCGNGLRCPFSETEQVD